jgi:hypothetical protein
MEPFGLDDEVFNDNVIDLPIVVSSLPLGVEISVGDSCDCEDCAVGGKYFGLLWRFMDL